MSGAVLIYSLCVATSATCAGLLGRAYVRTRTRLLLWTSASFLFFALNNLLLALDLLVFTEIDLWAWRQLAAGLGVATLICGFIWESR